MTGKINVMNLTFQQLYRRKFLTFFSSFKIAVIFVSCWACLQRCDKQPGSWVCGERAGAAEQLAPVSCSRLSSCRPRSSPSHRHSSQRAGPTHADLGRGCHKQTSQGVHFSRSPGNKLCAKLQLAVFRKRQYLTLNEVEKQFDPSTRKIKEKCT
jgi:hypothetical protein